MENAITVTQPTDSTMQVSPDSDTRLINLWLHGRPQTTQRSYLAAADRLVAHRLADDLALRRLFRHQGGGPVAVALADACGHEEGAQQAGADR